MTRNWRTVAGSAESDIASATKMRQFERQRRPHRHGCSGWPHPYQVLAWAIAVVTVASFYVLILPMLRPVVGISAGLLYSLLCLFSLVSGVLTTALDPTDSVVPTQVLASKQLPVPQQSCSICKVRVHDYSKHCAQCNRCVQGFDHHCKWLNNCVGKRNYACFAVLIGSASALLAQEIALGVYVLQLVYRREGEDRLGAVYGLSSENITAFTVVLAVVLLCLSLCFVPLMRLVLLQLYLRRRGITTYEYHLLCRQRK